MPCFESLHRIVRVKQTHFQHAEAQNWQQRLIDDGFVETSVSPDSIYSIWEPTQNLQYYDANRDTFLIFTHPDEKIVFRTTHLAADH